MEIIPTNGAARASKRFGKNIMGFVPFLNANLLRATKLGL
jgi:hypothetical protein